MKYVIGVQHNILSGVLFLSLFLIQPLLFTKFVKFLDIMMPITAVLRNLRACVIKFLTFILKLLYYTGLYFIQYKEIYSYSVISPMIFLGLKLSSRKLVLSPGKENPS
jgi:hypothetical protein